MNFFSYKQFFLYKFITLIVIFIPLFQLYKFIGFNSNLYDTGIELHNTYKIFQNDFSSLFEGHLKLFQIVFSKIFYLNNLKIEVYFFFFLQTIFIISPIFYLKNSLGKVLFLLNPITWIFLMGDFHYDYILIPIFLYVIFLYEKFRNNKFLHLSFIFIIVKEFYIIFSCLIGIYNFFSTRKKQWIVLFFFSFLSLIFILLKLNFFDFKTIFLIINNKFSFENIITSINTSTVGSTYISKELKIFLFFFIIFLNTLIFLPFKKNNLFLFIFIIYLLIYFLFIFTGRTFGLFSHYYLPFFLLILILADENKIKNYFKLRLICTIFLLFIFSNSPISYHFWLQDKNFIYSKKRFSYEIDNNALKIWLEKKNFSNNIIITSNNFLIPKLIKSKGLYGFPANEDFLAKADYVIINKTVISYNDRMCTFLSNCDFEKLYLEKIKKLEKFQIVFISNEYVIYFKRRQN